MRGEKVAGLCPALENPQELYPKGRIFAKRKSALWSKGCGFRGFFGKPLNGAQGIVSRTFSPAHRLGVFFVLDIQWHYVRTFQVG